MQNTAKRLAWYKRRMNKVSPPPLAGRAPRPPEGRVRGGEGEARGKGVGMPAVGNKHQQESPER